MKTKKHKMIGLGVIGIVLAFVTMAGKQQNKSTCSGTGAPCGAAKTDPCNVQNRGPFQTCTKGNDVAPIAFRICAASNYDFTCEDDKVFCSTKAKCEVTHVEPNGLIACGYGPPANDKTAKGCF